MSGPLDSDALRRSTPTGARRTTSRSARSTCSTTRCCASRCASSTSSRGCSATGARRPGLNFLYAHLNRAIRARDLDAIYVTGPGPRRARRWSPTPTSRAPTARSTRTSAAGRGGHARACSGSSPSRAASPATSRPRRPARSTRAASSATRSCTPTARRSTTPTCSSRCVVGDGEAETGPLAASWHSNKFLDPRARRRGAADPAPQRLQDRQPDRAGAHPADGAARAARAATATTPLLRRGRRPGGDAPARWPRRSTRCSTRSRRSRRGARRAAGDRPRWPMIVLRTPKGWTGPEGGRRPPGRGHVPLPPGAAGRARREPRAPRAARGVDAQLPARGAVRRRRARSSPSCAALAADGRPAHERQPARQRRPAAARPRAARLPRLRRRRSPRPGDARPARRRGCSARFLRDVIARERRRATSGCSARTRPRPTGCGAVFEATDRAWDAEIARRRRPPRARRPRHGGAQRAPVPGLAGGLPAHRPPRAVQLLRGVHPHRRLDVQPARQVAEGHARHPVAAADRLAELPAHLARLAPGPQRLLPPGPGLHRPRRQQEGRDHPGLPAAGRQHACCRSPTTACAAATTSTSSSPASSRAGLAVDGRRRSRTARAASASGTGRAPTSGGEPDVVLGLRRRRARRWRRWPRPRCCASTCPSSRCASSTSST